MLVDLNSVHWSPNFTVANRTGLVRSAEGMEYDVEFSELTVSEDSYILVYLSLHTDPQVIAIVLWFLTFNRNVGIEAKQLNRDTSSS